MDIKGIYHADANRYSDAEALYKRCGKSGILLPKISLGFWHNFGEVDPYERSRAITHYAFDHGITHFDLANNYGPPYGSAEETMGRLMKDDFKPYRDELFISTKAGYDMWEGPYGNWGSRKYLMASLNQSLKRMNLEYVDLFYSHRYDPNTPLEETLQAMVDIVKQGKALYLGISRWPLEALKFADQYLKERDCPLLIFQDRLNMLDHAPQENGTLDYCAEKRHRFHLVLTFGTGTSHRPISQRNTGRQPYGKRAFSETLCSNSRTAGTAQEMERRSRRKRRNTRRNGTCLDIAAERCNQRIGRSQLYRPAGKEHEVCAC